LDLRPFRNRVCEIGTSKIKIEEFKTNMKRLHDYGIVVLGAFVFGFDSDDKDVFKRTVDFVYDARLDLVQFSILTPLPGTRLHKKLSQENRIINTDWAKYDMENVVFKPAQMSVDELQQGNMWAWREFYSRGSIIRRLLGTRFDIIRIALYTIPLIIMNLGFKKALDFNTKLRKKFLEKELKK